MKNILLSLIWFDKIIPKPILQTAMTFINIIKKKNTIFSNRIYETRISISL